MQNAQNIHTILTRLYRIKKEDDEGQSRGILPQLRHALIPNKQSRAWPALSRIGIDPSDTLSIFIAACFATHPVSKDNENTYQSFAHTCKKIQLKREETQAHKSSDTKDKGSKLTPTEKRLLKILVTNTHSESERLDGIYQLIRLAKTKKVPIDYAQLYSDLKNWNDDVKKKWASDFWGHHEQASKDTSKESEEDFLS